jgi:ABC-type molybdate transport system substrate-binding protein
MRVVLAAVLAAACLAAPAQAVTLRVLTPAVVMNSGLKDLAAAYTKQTGVKVDVVTDTMGAIMGHTKTATPVADVVMLPTDFMNSLSLDKGIVDGSYVPLGRVYIGMAVAKGAPHPDISTVAKLAAVLKSAKGVLYSNPSKANGSMSAQMIDRMLKRPEFAGVHGVITTSFNGVGSLEGGQALASGKYPGHVALQLICEILNHPEISLAGPLPVELGMYIDTATAVSSRSAQSKDAMAFVRYITRAEAKPVWTSRGLNRF